MKTKSNSIAILLALAFSVSLCLGGKAFPQSVIEGVSTRAANGSTLPSGAAYNTFFILTGSTPSIYICNNSPACTSSGQWVLSSGSGSGCSGCAVQALSNLSGVALNVPLQSASGVNAVLEGFNGTSGAGPTSAYLQGGVGYSGSSQAGGSASVTGGAGGSGGGTGGNVSITGGANYAGPGGLVSIIGGAASGSNLQGGQVTIAGANGSGTGAGGWLVMNSGNGGGSAGSAGGNIVITAGIGSSSEGTGGNITLGAGTGGTREGILSFAGGGAPVLSSISGYGGPIPSAIFNLGTGSASPTFYINNNSSVTGTVFLNEMVMAWGPTDNTIDFDTVSARPRDAYLGRNLYVGGNISVTGTATYSGGMTLSGALSANSFTSTGSGAWSVQGSYGTLSVAPAGKTRFGFGPNGPQYSFNGGALTYFATLDSAGVNVTQNALTATKLQAAGTDCAGSFSTGLADAYGNAACSTATYIQLPQISAPTGVSGYGQLWFDSGGAIKANVNNTGAVQIGFSILNQSTDTLVQSDLANPQTYDFYAATDAGFANYNRLRMAFDATNSNFLFSSEYGGTAPDCSGGACGIEWQIGSSVKWMIDTSSRFRPYADNAVALGTSSISPSSVYSHQFCITSSCITSWPAGISYPAAGVMISTGSAYGTSIAETNNYVLVGVSGAWTAAAITGAMLPNPSASTLGGIESITSASHNWVSYIDTSGVPHQSQPAFSDISGSVGSTQLPNPSATTLGGIESITSASHNWITYIDTSGVPHQSQPGFSDLSGAATAAQGGTTMTALPACSWITVPTEGGSGNAFPSSVTNKAIVWGVYNPFPCVTNNVAYVVGTADNTSNTYALGLLTGTSAGTATIIASTASTAGTSFAASSGIKTIAWNAGSITVPAGRVYIALTSSCSSACAALLGTSGTGVTYAANQQVSVGTGGAAFSGSITLPTDTFSSGASIPSLVVY